MNFIDNIAYRDTSYFNDEDYYLVATNLNKHLVTKLAKYNGNWYTVSGMEYKATSVRMIKFSDSNLIGREVELNGHKGVITKQFLNPSDVGVIWNGGQKGFPSLYYWNNINKLKIIYTKEEQMARFRALVSPGTSGWLEKAKWRKANRGWIRKSQNIALKILRELREVGITKEYVAEEMGLTLEEFITMLRGSHDYTLSEIAKLEKILEVKLVTTPYEDRGRIDEEE